MGEPGAWGNFKGMLRGEVDASMLEAFPLVGARMASASERFRVRRALPAALPLWDRGHRPAGHLRVLQSMCDFLLGRLTPVVGWYRDLPVAKASHEVSHAAMPGLLRDAVSAGR